MTVYLYAFSRVFSNSFFTLFQKRITVENGDPAFIMGMNYILLFIVSLVIVLLMPIKLSLFPKGFWIAVIGASLLDALGNIFLIQSLSNIDLSLFGPLNAYKPILAIVVAFFMIHEIPNDLGILGMLIIFFGAYFLTYNKTEESDNKNNGFFWLFRLKGFWFRMIAILLFVVASVFTKEAVQRSSPEITMLFWSFFGLPVVLPIVLFSSKKGVKRNLEILTKKKRDYFLMFCSMCLMQLFTILTYGKLLVAYSLAIFQLSSVLSVIYGYFFFKEQNIKYRMIGSVIMIVGVVTIGIGYGH